MIKPKNLLAQILKLIIRSKMTRDKLRMIYKMPQRRKKYKENKKRYIKDKRAYCDRNKRKNFEFVQEYEWPVLGEWREQAGAPGEYFWQDLWCAEKIVEKRPDKHFDIGSRIDGFIAHLVLLKIPVTLIDIRPLNKAIPGVDFFQADATKLENIKDNSIASLSALCSLEHFGLGRYGDKIAPEACFDAFEAVQRVVQPGGDIYLSLPIGKERLCFNAHRVFNPYTVISEFGKCVLKEYSVIDLESNPVLIQNCNLDKYAEYLGGAMGLFWFQKK